MKWDHKRKLLMLHPRHLSEADELRDVTQKLKKKNKKEKRNTLSCFLDLKTAFSWLDHWQHTVFISNIRNFLSSCYVSFHFKCLHHNMLVKGSSDNCPNVKQPLSRSDLYDLPLWHHRYHSEEGSDELLFLLKWQRTNGFISH